MNDNEENDDEENDDEENDNEEDVSVKTNFEGQAKVRGDAFDNYAADDVVKTCGQIVFTTPVVTQPKCRFKIVGQLIVPEGSEKTLAPAIMKMSGQMIYYPDGVQPRIVMGKETFGQAFFQAMTEREVLINLGHTCLAADVQGQIIRERIHSIINLGVIKCSKALLPVVQVLCRDNLGRIEAE